MRERHFTVDRHSDVQRFSLIRPSGTFPRRGKGYSVRCLAASSPTTSASVIFAPRNTTSR